MPVPFLDPVALPAPARLPALTLSTSPFSLRTLVWCSAASLTGLLVLTETVSRVVICVFSVLLLSVASPFDRLDWPEMEGCRDWVWLVLPLGSGWVERVVRVL